MSGAILKSAALSGCLCIGCVEAPRLPQPSEPPVVSFSPGEGDRPWPATRISIDVGNGSRLEPDAVRLFEGAISETKLERLDDDEPPKTLTDLGRAIVSWWSDDAHRVFVQPLAFLTPGGAYTLAARGIGKLASFVVSEAPEVPVLERTWPPRGDRAGGQIVLCGRDAPRTPSALVLAPGNVAAELVPGLGSAGELRCNLVRFDAKYSEGRLLVLPPEIDGCLVEPSGIEIGVREELLTFPMCAGEEVELGPGCARAEDDRLVVRNAGQPLLWRFHAFKPEEEPRLVVAAANAEFVLRGLTPGTALSVTGSVIATDGAEVSFSAQLTTTAARTRIVLNEVLANPIGPEPAAEWVELFNAGAASVRVAGMRLRDSAGSVELPDVAIEPGDFVLVVREDFAPGPTDVPPALGAPRIVVPQLAKNGLANSGEPLALLDATGQVLSSFPAIAAPHAGVSLARAHPDALDTDASAFSEHSSPGASPGAANSVSVAK